MVEPPAELSARMRAIVKAYDVRGLVPSELDETVAAAVGAAFVSVAGVPREGGAVAIGRDMRISSPALASAVADGVRSLGADVVDIGLASTDLLYFASGRLDLPGVMVTASHNPARYNGLKLCRAGAVPVGSESGLAEIQAMVAAQLAGPAPRRRAQPDTRVEHRDLLDEYVAHLHRLAPVRGRHLRVVVDAGNGMAGHTAPAVFADLDVDLVPLYFELDGDFPHHEANPIEPANLRDLQQAVVAQRADIGLAFDGDADRCFMVDERGDVVSPSAITAMIAVRELDREPGATIVHNLITSRAVPEVVREHGGSPWRTRVGHSYIKAVMAETGAVFGGEHSGHFYFRDFWRADSGMLAALHTLAVLAANTRPLSELAAEYTPYSSSGEINSTVTDQGAALARVEAAYADREDVDLDHLDGLTVSHRRWWFNVRASNTEPLLRLNVEGVVPATMVRVRDEVLTLVRSEDR